MATIIGTNGDDYLDGTTGADLLDGGLGNDYLYGGLGNDTYVFGIGDGQDFIEDDGGNDTIVLGPGILPSDLIVSISTSDFFQSIYWGIKLEISGTNDSVFIYGADADASYIVEKIQFDDGSVWSITADGLVPYPYLNPTNGNDVLIGSSGADVISGLAGDDILNGMAGGDRLTGGTGNDVLNGGAGSDNYYFNLGDGVDIINDVYAANDTNDIHFGTGITSDSLGFGLDGNSLVIRVGSGGDTIYVSNIDTTNIYANGGLPIDVLYFSNGSYTGLSQLISQKGFDTFGTEGDDSLGGALLVHDRIYGFGGNDILDPSNGEINGSGGDYLAGGTGDDTYYSYGDTIVENANEGIDTVYAYFSITLGANIENLVLLDLFTSGLSGRGNELNNVITGSSGDDSIYGGAGNDTLIGGSGADALRGEAGDDSLSGGDGNDYLAGGQGSDVIYGENNNDSLYGEDGSDFLDGGSGNDNLSGGEGNDQLEGGNDADTLYGDNGNDILHGGAGNDILYGGSGTDTYLFNLGDGADVIRDNGSRSEHLRVVFGEGITASDLVMQRGLSGLTIQVGAGGDSIQLHGIGSAASPIRYSLSNYVNIDLVFTDINATGANYIGTTASDFYIGTAFDDYLQGLGGGDALFGGDGNDILDGRGGSPTDDYLFGGVGDDTYYVDGYFYDVGYIDVVVERPGEGTDTVISASNFDIGARYITYVEFLNSDYTAIENLTLIGTAAYGRGNELDNVLTGNDSDNYLDGNGGNDTLIGGAGDDWLYDGDSTETQDTLIGGLGDDFLYGDNGNDTYVFNRGDGRDVIYEYDPAPGNLDTIRFTAGVSYNDVLFSQDGTNIYLDIAGSTDQIKIADWYLNDRSKVERVEFSDGTTWNITGSGLEIFNEAPVIQFSSALDPIRLVSAAADGTVGNSYSNLHSISADGRYVTFMSDSSNFVAGDMNGAPDVFVKDLLTGAITRVSTAADGTEASGPRNGQSESSSITADGRYVLFYSFASNLVPDDTNGVPELFLKDLLTGAISRIGTASDGTEANGESANANITPDGRYVAFQAVASNLVAGDTNGTADVFVKDLQTGIVTRVSTAADGAEGNGYSLPPSISADGRYVAFYSLATNLVADDTNGVSDIFVKDLLTGAITRVNTAADGTEANGGVDSRFSISADGRYVSFFSDASNLVVNDTNGTYDIFVKDLQTGRIARLNIPADGVEDNYGYAPSISADGQYVAFGSYAPNLVAGDTNGWDDIFILSNPLFSPPELSIVTSADTPVVFDGLSVSDADAGIIPLAVTLSVAHGSLVLQDATSLTFTDADGSDGTLTFNGLLSDLNAAFAAGILYTPAFGYSGNDELDIFVDDQVPFGGSLTDTAAVAITITPAITGTSGSDALVGTSANDIFIGGAGNDTLTGGAGNDTYIFNLGDGVDTIDDLTLMGEGNALELGAGIDPSALTLSYEGGYLVLNLGGGDQLRLSNFSNTDVYGAHAVETLTFADGTVLSYSQLIDRGFDIVGTAGDDVIYGTNAVDRIVGGDGNDTIIGGGGNDIVTGGSGDNIIQAGEGDDIINGGAGNDTLYGGAGNDTYVFDAGNGSDTIYDSASESNTLVFGAGVDPASVTLNLGSLFINIGNGEGVHLENFDPNDVFGSSIIQTFVFADGTTLDLASLLALGFDINGTDGDDTLNGTNITDRVTGGRGNDSLSGGAGDDTYFYNLGDGLDQLADSSGTDTVSFGSGISFANTVLRKDGNTAHLRLLDADGNETEGMDIALNGDGTSPIEMFSFIDGSRYHLDDFLIYSQTTTTGNGNDSLITGRNDDTVTTGNGNDTVHSGTGNDALYGENGNDALYGEGGNDSLYGGKGKDLLDGGAGDDYLDGGEGKNTLIGGKGNDTLILVEDGQNDILFNSGDGWDTLKTNAKDSGHDNEILFGGGIAHDDLWFSRSGNDLNINVLGTNDGMTIEGWYSNKHKPIEEFQTSDGYELEDKQVQLLVQAMAAFTPAPGSGGVLPTEMPDQLQATLAAAWESD